MSRLLHLLWMRASPLTFGESRLNVYLVRGAGLAPGVVLPSMARKMVAIAWAAARRDAEAAVFSEGVVRKPTLAEFESRLAETVIVVRGAITGEISIEQQMSQHPWVVALFISEGGTEA